MTPSVQDVLKERIAGRGPVSFSEFMELALYWPHGGYYSEAVSERHPADFFTAPAAHPAYGALLSLQLEEMWRVLGRPPLFTIVEPGAGTGLLSLDILRYAQYLDPEFQRAVRYCAIDRSPRHRLPGAVLEWIRAVGVPLRGLTGCVLSNELLDAFPVHRVTVREGRLQELFVGYKDGQFVEVIGEPSTAALSARLEAEGVTLAEGQRAEICLALEPWIQDAAASLERGFVLTVDYGHPAQALYAPERRGGSLRCYYRHTLSGNPYDRVGAQDITAHVDFTAVTALGERYGLSSHGLEGQGVFLANLGLAGLQRKLTGQGLRQQERDANRMGMLELGRAGGMGEFKVLVQSKGIDEARLTGLEGGSSAWSRRLEELPLPLLGEEHLKLMEARYPHTAWQWGG
ncbi:MAG: SAM-dependent methyltransferase [Chloroflexi bacterium]|nr:SAM-dependent methyltransferase [Chloroflexota bacterium]